MANRWPTGAARLNWELVPLAAEPDALSPPAGSICTCIIRAIDGLLHLAPSGPCNAPAPSQSLRSHSDRPVQAGMGPTRAPETDAVRGCRCGPAVELVSGLARDSGSLTFGATRTVQAAQSVGRLGWLSSMYVVRDGCVGSSPRVHQATSPWQWIMLLSCC